jgi:trimeric autotransporter adhesin
MRVSLNAVLASLLFLAADGAPRRINLEDVNRDGVINCDDVAMVRTALGRARTQRGHDEQVDVNGDGVIDIRDLAAIARRMSAGAVCK